MSGRSVETVAGGSEALTQGIVQSANANTRANLNAREERAASLSFDYSMVSDRVADFLRAQASKVREHAASSIIAIGRDLTAAKHYLSHGQFVCWVECEIGVPARTAQMYMQLCRWIGKKSANVAHLPVSTLYLLSAKSTPEEYAVEVLRRLEAGEHIPVSSLRRELKERKRRAASALSEPSGRSCAPLGGLECAADLAFDRDKMNSIHLAVELVEILTRGLSESELAHVRKIVTDASVRFDVYLAQRLLAVLPHRLELQAPDQLRMAKRPPLDGVRSGPAGLPNGSYSTRDS